MISDFLFGVRVGPDARLSGTERDCGRGVLPDVTPQVSGLPQRPALVDDYAGSALNSVDLPETVASATLNCTVSS
jgi:hypothetical protein